MGYKSKKQAAEYARKNRAAIQAKEPPEERELRLAVQRERMAKYRQRLKTTATSLTPEQVLPVSDARIASARTKPAGCSDVRWRIELRRRKIAKRLGDFSFTLLCN